MKKYILTIVITAIICIGGTVLATNMIESDQVAYNDTTVKDALDLLYDYKHDIKTSELLTNSMYKNDRAGNNTVSINLNAGKYLCVYDYVTAGTMSDANVRTEWDENRTTNCDETNILYSKGYTTGGNALFGNSFYISFAKTHIIFTCTMNSAKAVTLNTNNGNNGYGLPADSRLECVEIKK